uniref:Uncharacterized protein n=1 Tax=viral metagenome TaxID=1070528 RepID=A0A6H1ZS16_9ZZZZ
MNVYTVSLTRSIYAKTEEEALYVFEHSVIEGGDWDSDSIDIELEECNDREKK